MTQVVQVFRNFRMSSERSLQCVHPSELYPSLLFRLAQPKRKTVIPPHGVTRVLRAFLRPCWRLGLFRLGLFRPFVTAEVRAFPFSADLVAPLPKAGNVSSRGRRVGTAACSTTTFGGSCTPPPKQAGRDRANIAADVFSAIFNWLFGKRPNRYL